MSADEAGLRLLFFVLVVVFQTLIYGAPPHSLLKQNSHPAQCLGVFLVLVVVSTVVWMCVAFSLMPNLG